MHLGVRDRLSSITLRQLQVLAALAREGSFTRAAESLYVSQSTVSEQLRALEQVVGARLVRRGPGRQSLALTPSGQILLESSVEVERVLDEALVALERLTAQLRGVVRFGADHVFAGQILHQLYDAYRRTFPEISVRLEVDRRGTLLADVGRHRLDLAVVVGPVEDPALIAQPAGQFDMVLVGPPGHRLAGSGRVPFSTLAGEALILPDSTALFRRTIDQLARESGIELNVIMEVSNIDAQTQAVMGGLGIAPVSYRSAADLLATQRLVILDVEPFPVTLQWDIVHLPGALDACGESLKDYVARFLSSSENPPRSVPPRDRQS